jgi:small conductance mechanosensitive channel
MDNIALVDKARLLVVDYGMKIIFAIVIFVFGRWLALIVANLVEKSLRKTKLNRTLVSFLKNITYFTLLIFVFIAVLNKLGVETTSFVALVGAAGLAIGLAFQGSLANFAAGVMIVILHPFEVGDFIEADGASGEVKEIQIFSTIIAGDNNKKIIIPNAKITGDKITVTAKK